MNESGDDTTHADAPTLPYAQPDTDPKYRDDEAGLLVREALDHPISWVFHGGAFAFLTILPTASWAWSGFPIDPNPLKDFWLVVCAIGFGTWGVFALMRPTNWREVYIDLQNRRVDVRWRRWLRPGGSSFALAEFDRVVIVEEVDGRRVTPNRVEIRRPWGSRGEPVQVLVMSFASKDKMESLAKRISERTGLRLDRYREAASS
jgi:hypothetical protein